MKNVRELSEIRELKILSAGQNNESSRPVFFIVYSQHCDWNVDLTILFFFMHSTVISEQLIKTQQLCKISESRETLFLVK